MKPLVFLCKLWLSVFKKEKKACNCTFHKPQMSSFHLWFKWLHHRTLLTPHVSPCFTVKRANSSKTLQRFCKYCCLWRPFLVMIRKQTKHLVSLNREGGGVLWELSSPKRRTHTRTIRARARSTLLARRLAQLCTAWKPALLLHFNYTTLSSRQLYRKHAQLK